MAEVKQYAHAKDLNVPARLKLVGTLYGRGFSPTRIARELNYDLRTAQKDIAMVINQIREFDDVERHLRDVTARMGEQLTKLNEQESILWKQLDWATEWVIQTDGMGKPIYENDPDAEADDGVHKKPNPLYGPRRPNMVMQLVNQLQTINKQQAELLGLMHKNVDISVTLQKTEALQIRIVEAIKDTDPDTYRKLLRQLQAIEATVDRPALPSRASQRDVTNIMEGEYEPAHVSR